jgi:hypothetical protein
MTTKMSNDMAAKIKTMASVITASLLTVSTPAWVFLNGFNFGTYTPHYVQEGPFKGISISNQLKYTLDGAEETYLIFKCYENVQPSQALIFGKRTFSSEKLFQAFTDQKHGGAGQSTNSCTTSKGVEVIITGPRAVINPPVLKMSPGTYQTVKNLNGMWELK